MQTYNDIADKYTQLISAHASIALGVSILLGIVLIFIIGKLLLQKTGIIEKFQTNGITNDPREREDPEEDQQGLVKESDRISKNSFNH